MTTIFIFVPTYKNQLTATTFLTTHALRSLLESKGIKVGVSAISSPDIEWVRNFALTYWYDKQKQYSHLLFIDDDMGFMPDVVMDMLLFNEPVVGAIYPKKTMDRQWAASGVANPETRGPFLEVQGLGCGCFLIRRDAIDTMLQKMPELIDTRYNAIEQSFLKNEGMTRLITAFSCMNDPERGRVSEDISFGRRWIECGGKVWAATHHKMVHVGPHEYSDTYVTWANDKKKQLEESQNDELAKAPILKENSVLKGKACKHGLFIYNPNDTFIGRSLENYGEWCEFEIDLLSKFIKPGDTVIDVGANIGTHTVPFSRMVGKDGRVFAFEAQPRLEEILEANIHLNKLGNVVWDNKAIGSEMGIASVPKLPPDTSSYNFGALSFLEENRIQETTDSIVRWDGMVDTITIDSFCSDLSPSLIKIDVEGMEPDVIQGATSTIVRCKPILYVENNGEDSSKIWDVLQQIGYGAYWSIGPYFNPNNVFRNKTNIWPTVMPSVNLICVPRDSEHKFLDLPFLIGPNDNWKKAILRIGEAYQVIRALDPVYKGTGKLEPM